MRAKMHELIAAETAYPLAEAVVDSFIDLGTVVEYGPGEAITAEGSVDPGVYMLVEGIIRSWCWDGIVEKTAYFGTPGTMCVSFHSYLMGQAAPNTHEACCRSLLLRVSRESFNRLIDESHDFAKWALVNAQQQLYFFERKNRLIQGSARERYESLLKNRPEVARNVPLKMIASYLGITPQYLSRLRARMR